MTVWNVCSITLCTQVLVLSNSQNVSFSLSVPDSKYFFATLIFSACLVTASSTVFVEQLFAWQNRKNDFVVRRLFGWAKNIGGSVDFIQG